MRKIYIEIVLEKIIQNKSYWILIFLAFGIILRFKYLVVCCSIYTITTVILLILNFTSYKLYHRYTIKNDLKILNNYNIYYYSSIKYLLLIVLTIAMLWISIGFFTASIRFSLINHSEQKEIKSIYLIGKVVEYDIRDNGFRIYLKNIYYSNRFGDIEQKFNANTVRLNLRYDVQNLIGKYVLVRTSLMPPPSMMFPNSFNFAEYALFKGISAIGFVLQKPIIINTIQHEKVFFLNNVLNNVYESLNKLRKTIAHKISDNITNPAASIASAILVGETTQISQNDYYALRVSGLAHIIAISGMHVVVVIGIIFITIRMILLYLIPIITNYQIALYFSIEKISAAISMVCAVFYVLLAGSPVSAQRALLTSCTLMMCIILNIRINPIKSLCIAATVMLLITPEVLFSPGLQMSFAACFALIKAFSIFKVHFKIKCIEYLAKVIIASIAASIATLPFIIYHFNQFAPYGILANLVCVPLSDFVIMPFGMLSMLFMPFNLEQYPLKVVQLSLDFMLCIARQISILPFADIHISSFTNYGITIISLGLFILCISSDKIYAIFSIILIMIGCSQIHNYDDILLIINAKTFAIREDLLLNNIYNKKFILSSKQKNRFVHEVWQTKLGKNRFESDSLQKFNKKNKLSTNCNHKLCIITYPFNILIVNDDIDFKLHCHNQKIFVNMFNSTKCDNVPIQITAQDLKLYGTHVIDFNNIIKSQNAIQSIN